MTLHNIGPASLGRFEITPGLIRSVLLEAAQAVGVTPRYDASNNPILPPGTLEAYARHVDGLALDKLRADGWSAPAELMDEARRADALTPGAAGFLRDFEFIHTQILEEPLPELNGLTMFPADTSVPVGAKTHTMRRSVVTGKAKWHKRGEAVPLAKAGYLEETFKTGYVVCGVEVPYIESLAVNFAGLPTYRLEASGAVRAVREFLNDVALAGDSALGIYGALTYPHLAKTTLSTSFSSSSTGEAVVRALTAAVNWPRDNSKSLFRPNRMAVPEALYTYLTTEPYATAGGTTTIAEFFLMGQRASGNGIQRIEIMHELSATELTAISAGNPSGYDGIFCWNDSMNAGRHVLPQAPMFLPIFQQDPFTTVQVVLAQTGGIVMPDPGNSILIFVTRS